MTPWASDPVDEVVLDTNVLLDWLVFQNPVVDGLIRALDGGQLRWVATPAMWDELAGVLKRDFQPARSQRASTALERATPYRRLVATPQPMPDPAPRCSDAADQMFIDLAWARATRWLISRDKALLRLARRALSRQIRVVRPEQWTELADGASCALPLA